MTTNKPPQITRQIVDLIYEQAPDKTGGSGFIVCPICGKEIKYYVEAYSFRVSAKCETDKCVTITM